MASIGAWADGKGMYYDQITYQAVVHEDNTWDITETVNAVFIEPHHGIYKYIHKNYGIIIPRIFLGYEYSQNVRFDSDVDFDDDAFKIDGQPTDFYDVIDKDDVLGVKMGDGDVTLTGRHSYQMTYKYSYPADQNANADLLMHTLLPGNMEVETKKLVFRIKFDKALPEAVRHNIEYFRGPVGSTEKGNKDDIVVEDEHTLSGTLYNIRPYNAVTIRTELPEGFFTNGPDRPWHHAAFYFFAFAMVIAVITCVWALFKRRNVVTKQIEFYPPEGMCSAEVGVIIDGSVDQQDLASLIPWFASQGYINIGEAHKGKGKTAIWIKRIKQLPDDAPEYQKLFMKGLFDSQRAEKVELSKLRYTNKMEKASDALDDMFNDEKSLVDESGSLAVICVILLGYFSLWTNTNMSLLSSDGLWYAGWLFLFYALPTLLSMYNVSKMYGNPYCGGFTKFFAAIGKLIGAIVAVMLFVFFDADVYDMGMFFITFVGTCITVDLSGRLIVDTDYRLKYLGKLMGLKEFIETAEKQRLDELVHDDPEYFYKVLPFAMALGVSSEWGEKFKDIKMEQPEWLKVNSTSHFHVNHFCDSLSSASNTGMSTASTDPSNSSSWSGSSSSSSWGGSSGGGGGGGGGGGW